MSGLAESGSHRYVDTSRGRAEGQAMARSRSLRSAHSGLFQRVQQYLCVLQVGSVEAPCEPVVDHGEEAVGIGYVASMA